MRIFYVFTQHATDILKSNRPSDKLIKYPFYSRILQLNAARCFKVTGCIYRRHIGSGTASMRCPCGDQFSRLGGYLFATTHALWHLYL